MAHIVRFLQPIRFNPFPLRFSCFAKFDRFHTLTNIKSLEASSVTGRISSSNWKSYVRSYIHKSNYCSSGRKVSMAQLCGMSIVVGSVGFLPHYASSMDVYDTSRDDHRMNLAASDSEESPPAFLILVKKLLAPIVLLYIVLTNWGHPAIIGAKAIIILLSTKPSPLTIYVVIDKWRKEFKDQHPLLHKFKSLYAYKVEVEDYGFLCVARVELIDKKYTVVGILGGWWAFERTSLQGTLLLFQKRVAEILKTSVLL